MHYLSPFNLRYVFQFLDTVEGLSHRLHLQECQQRYDTAWSARRTAILHIPRHFVCPNDVPPEEL